MRSTGFVVLSILVHAMAVAAIALHPQRITEGPSGNEVEVTMGELSEQPGTADAPADKVTENPQASAQPQLTPVPPTPSQPAVEKPVEKPANLEKKAAPVVKKAPVKKAAPVAKSEPAPEKTETAAPPTEAQPESLDPSIEENVQTVQSQETKPEPVKEETAAAVSADHQTEAAAQTEQKPADPVAESAPAGASKEIGQLTQGANNTNGTGELGHGGATPAGAVDHTELKQMQGNRAPMYPLSARREKRQGDVELLYRVTKDGRVADVRIDKSSGSEDLDKEAVRAISKFRFVPGQEGWARHPVQFTLKGDTAEAPSRLRTKVGAQDQE